MSADSQKRIVIYFRTTSIKTRIETINILNVVCRNIHFRTTSIKTRIETGRVLQIQFYYFYISEPLPSKQGLKQINGLIHST